MQTHKVVEALEALGVSSQAITGGSSPLTSLVASTPDATATEKGKIKLAGDLSGTADSPQVVDDSHNHTSSTITDMTEAVQDIVGVMMTAGAGISVNYDDPSGLVTITCTLTQYTDEMAQDAIGSLLTAGAGISLNYDDALNTLTITGTVTQYTDEMAQDAVGGIVTNSSNITITYNDSTPSISADLTNTGVVANVYGSATNIPVITVDEKGRITSVTETTHSINDASDVNINSPIVNHVLTHSGTEWVNALLTQLGVATQDTIANIEAMTPTAGRIAYATDRYCLMYANGSAWYRGSELFIASPNRDDIGGTDFGAPSGYGYDYVDGKRMTNMVLGGNTDMTKEGAKRVLNGVEQVTLNGVVKDVVTGLRFREDATEDYQLEVNPVGLVEWYSVMNGNSDSKGVNGVPTSQEFRADIGGDGAFLVIDGGYF